MIAAKADNALEGIRTLEDLTRRYPSYKKVLARSKKLYHELINETGAHTATIVLDAVPGKKIDRNFLLRHLRQEIIRTEMKGEIVWQQAHLFLTDGTVIENAVEAQRHIDIGAAESVTDGESFLTALEDLEIPLDELAGIAVETISEHIFFTQENEVFYRIPGHKIELYRAPATEILEKEIKEAGQLYRMVRNQYRDYHILLPDGVYTVFEPDPLRTADTAYIWFMPVHFDEKGRRIDIGDGIFQVTPFCTADTGTGSIVWGALLKQYTVSDFSGSYYWKTVKDFTGEQSLETVMEKTWATIQTETAKFREKTGQTQFPRFKV